MSKKREKKKLLERTEKGLWDLMHVKWSKRRDIKSHYFVLFYYLINRRHFLYLSWITNNKNLTPQVLYIHSYKSKEDIAALTNIFVAQVLEWWPCKLHTIRISHRKSIFARWCGGHTLYTIKWKILIYKKI